MAEGALGKLKAAQGLASAGLSPAMMMKLSTEPLVAAAKAWARVTPWGAAGAMFVEFLQKRAEGRRDAKIVRESHDEAIRDITAKIWGIEIEVKEGDKK
jgi:hypothetical protein